MEQCVHTGRKAPPTLGCPFCWFGRGTLVPERLARLLVTIISGENLNEPSANDGLTQGLRKIKLHCQLEPQCFTEVGSGLHLKQPTSNMLHSPELDAPQSPLRAWGVVS